MILTIAVIDIVFSLDSVITAVGMVDDVLVMIAAMVIAMLVMLVFAGPIGRFVDGRPTVKVLALSFLILIGVAARRRGAGAAPRQGVHLLRDGVRRRRRGREPATAQEDAGRHSHARAGHRPQQSVTPVTK